MASPSTSPEDAPKKGRSILPLIMGALFLTLGTGAGFAAVRMGFVGGPATADHGASESSDADHDIDPPTFLAFDPLVINLADPSGRRFLRFTTQIQVAPEHLADVEAIKPRLIDVLNGYLRAVPTSELEDPQALIWLRSQMLRRLQLVAGQDRITDLLIMEFVVN